MKSTVQVASPPPKPLMIYDGDCRFCTLWIHRWQCATGESVDYLLSQDPQVGERFPEIPHEAFASSVQLIEPDGTVYNGAEAVFQSLGRNTNFHWLLSLYRQCPPFAVATEWAYHLVARHRTFFSFATGLLWGRHVERPSYNFVRRAFLSSLAIIYFIAFVSLWVQVEGLYGSRGIEPVAQIMAQLRHEAVDANIGLSRYYRIPTLCWFNSSDAFLKFQCAAGTVLAVLLLIGVAPAPCLFLLWLIYLSLCSVGEPFLDFQWDILLLETGFLAIFFAPLQWLPRHPARERPPSRIVLWLLRWLLFKLMFQSGCVKLSSGDPTWRNGTALDFHFETQPLPTWIGWYAHQLPAWAHRTELWLLLAIEIGFPFLIFFPRRPRQLACIGFLALQLIIFLTGNYCFFNLLTMALCLPLLDDAALQKCLPHKWRNAAPPGSTAVPAAGCPRLRRLPRWHGLALTPLAAVVLFTSTIQLVGTLGMRLHLPSFAAEIYGSLMPFRSFNGYGLFAVMTTSRAEIIIEGSDDSVNWRAYEFKYKPGGLKRRPGFVEPHQPRLDWQMWFAALGSYRNNPWLVNFCVRLLQGSPEVLALMERNPFPNAPPKYIRAVVYDYQFTDIATRRKTGDWWRREPEGIYMPAISLRAEQSGPSGLPAEP